MSSNIKTNVSKSVKAVEPVSSIQHINNNLSGRQEDSFKRRGNSQSFEEMLNQEVKQYKKTFQKKK